MSGRVAVGDVVFRPGPVRVDTLRAAIGDRVSPGASLYDLTSSRPVVTAELKASRRDLVLVGDAVGLDLAGGGHTTGRIESVGAVAHVRDGGSAADATITLVISLDDPAAAAASDKAPVSVQIASATRKGVLAVPVTAIVALKGGGYAVERVSPDETREYVPVDLGMFAQGYVEITPSGSASSPRLVPGDRVVVAE